MILLDLFQMASEDQLLKWTIIGIVFFAGIGTLAGALSMAGDSDITSNPNRGTIIGLMFLAFILMSAGVFLFAKNFMRNR